MRLEAQKFCNYLIIYPQSWKHLEYQDFLVYEERVIKNCF